MNALSSLKPGRRALPPWVSYLLACLVVAVGSLAVVQRPLTAPLPDRTVGAHQGEED